MAQERPNRLVEWYLAAKEWAPTVPERGREWLEMVRAEPALIWQTTAIRYGVYALGVIVALATATFLRDLIAPPPPSDAIPQSQMADFHVLCAEPSCQYHFVINRKKSFDNFPVDCPKCGRETGAHAQQCWSPTCAGRWVAPVAQDGSLHCPQCGRELGRR